MNHKLWTSSVLAAALATAAGFAQAQKPSPPPHPMMQDAEAPGGAPFGPAIELLGFEGMHGGKIVTGAPFSGIAISETTQTLADGSHITRKVQSYVYRDSQGRFRKEVNLSGVGFWAEARKPQTFMVIQDPVANVGYSLDPEQKVARKKAFAGPRPNGTYQSRMESRIQRDMANGSLQKEDLGSQKINAVMATGDGVMATGTRYTRTIPVGQIGNDTPITTVYEQWYSNDLQVVVKSTRTDPRFGTTTYTLTITNRNEPDASLFQVPSNYTITEGQPRKPGARELREPPLPPPLY